MAPSALTPGGVIVWDNTDRAEYQPGVAVLRGIGFRQLRLRGLPPGLPDATETSLFYRDANCLGL